jgi:hypothetical protein
MTRLVLRICMRVINILRVLKVEGGGMRRANVLYVRKGGKEQGEKVN